MNEKTIQIEWIPMKRIAFHFRLQSTESEFVYVHDLAKYNQSELGNISFIVYPIELQLELHFSILFDRFYPQRVFAYHSLGQLNRWFKRHRMDHLIAIPTPNNNDTTTNPWELLTKEDFEKIISEKSESNIKE